MATATVEFIKALPKVELHIHIEGTLTPQLRFKLAKKHSIKLPWDSDEEMVTEYKKSFNEQLQGKGGHGSLTFFSLYYGSMDVLLTEDDFFELAMGYFTRAVEMKVRYAEVFFDPQAHTRRGVSLEAVMNGLRRAQLEAAEKFGFKCNWIMSFLRDEPVESAEETYEAALKYRDMIHGIGLDSYELGRSAMLFNSIYTRARTDGFNLTAHCDVNAHETHEHIHQCLTELGGDGIKRIDHGLNAVDRPELIRIIKEKGVGLTVCPWAYYGYLMHIQGEDRLFKHMIRKLFDEGVIISIGSDDPAYMGLNWVEDSLILLADKCHFTTQDIITMEENGIKISWAPEDLKLEIKQEIREFYAMWSQDEELVK